MLSNTSKYFENHLHYASELSLEVLLLSYYEYVYSNVTPRHMKCTFTAIKAKKH